MTILRFPLARITAFFVPGILFAYYVSFAAETLFLILAFGFLAFCLLYYFSRTPVRRNAYFGISVYFLAFIIGATSVAVHSGIQRKGNYIHRVNDTREFHLLDVVLRERLKSSAKNERYIGIVERIDGVKSSGKILVNIKKARNSQPLQIGTNMHITSVVYKHKKPYNPDQFDYGNYLSNKSVLAQLYTETARAKISTKITKDALYYSDLIRTAILGNLNHRIDKTELNVIAALILGQQQDLSPEIVHDYQVAGAVHILSVSGLHVGFILIFINFFLKFLSNNKWSSLLKVSIVILALWGFAVLAGLSPSVIRSVTMFSFVAIGMHLKRKTNIFHTLIVSILLILLFEPSFIFDVGFQLSYTALFFILWLQPILARRWQPKNIIVKYLWQILTVTFAAQIGAFPLSIYYFHQFPGLFFVTNLIIIPFLSVIMALGVCVIVLAAFNFVPEIPAYALEFAIRMLNKIINWIASFDSFIIEDIPFNKLMMASLYVSIVAIVICIDRSNFNKIAFALTSMIGFQLCCFGAFGISGRQKEWIVFSSKKSTLIAERQAGKITAYGNTQIGDNPILKSYAVANFSKVTQILQLKNTAWFNNNKILIIDSLGQYPKKVKPDVIVIRQSPKINMERLLRTCHPKIVIADASNFKSYIAKWKQTCNKEKIPFHAIAEKGYYKLH